MRGLSTFVPGGYVYDKHFLNREKNQSKDKDTEIDEYACPTRKWQECPCDCSRKE